MGDLVDRQKQIVDEQMHRLSDLYTGNLTYEEAEIVESIHVLAELVFRMIEDNDKSSNENLPRADGGTWTLYYHLLWG